ncbi:MAG: ABC transporter permease [Bryobacter sp.]|jgi:ABC-2 type transport system permease protein|nr:ABC transporter permease [Bryobacter sp. CoA8 C33]
MRNIITIARKEIQAYFQSPIAYVLVGAYAAMFGYFFWSLVYFFVRASMQSQMSGRAMPMNLNELVIRNLLGNCGVLCLFMIPMLTMRLFAEEKSRGTMELLLTSPLRDWEILLGKWAGAVTMYTSLLLFSGLNMVFLFAYGKPDWKPLAVGYLGLILQGAAMLALGMFLSSITQSQIAAAFSTFVLLLMLWVFEWMSNMDQNTLTTVLTYMSLLRHNESFIKGVIDLKDTVYYLSVSFFGLFLTARSLESLRYRG